MTSPSEDEQFARELEYARQLLDDDGVTAAVVGVVRDGEEVDTTFAQRADSPREEGLQALSLLAAHVRLVADQAGVDHTTVASDAASLAGAVDEIDPDALATAADADDGAVDSDDA
ncbi:Uncharacterized protein AArcCO_2670 [Halalkaliarchaeum sp. AArc-CO]|uniref:hypothetical protein n=1 Tax=unclassified Halalkaliarchaeum TaxID=2678344 RepID=UPI00217E0EA1|nr:MULTISPECIES: hypothetical protein [unclassified Halalkaliarchaeum]MDR5674284.1 hypothetical protein [Halalkaliarchaeum sp. AArc-GB]UWG51949.1 Uncharacterized protein AArcCO_2670 [Halalkaliarchaeum sp. AArc-CO]